MYNNSKMELSKVMSGISSGLEWEMDMADTLLLFFIRFDTCTSCPNPARLQHTRWISAAVFPCTFSSPITGPQGLFPPELNWWKLCLTLHMDLRPSNPRGWVRGCSSGAVSQLFILNTYNMCFLVWKVCKFNMWKLCWHSYSTVKTHNHFHVLLLTEKKKWLLKLCGRWQKSSLTSEDYIFLFSCNSMQLIHTFIIHIYSYTHTV